MFSLFASRGITFRVDGLAPEKKYLGFSVAATFVVVVVVIVVVIVVVVIVVAVAVGKKILNHIDHGVCCER